MFVPVVPSVNAAAPWIATVPVKLAALDMVWLLTVPELIVPDVVMVAVPRLRLPAVTVNPAALLTPPVAVISPEVLMVVIPDSAPAVDTSKVEESNWKVPVALPIWVLAVPVVFMLVAPVTVNPLPNIPAPLMFRFPVCWVPGVLDCNCT